MVYGECACVLVGEEQQNGSESPSRRSSFRRVGLAKFVETQEAVGEEGGEESLWRRLRVDRGGEEKSGAFGKRRQSSWAVVRRTEVIMRYSKRRMETPEC